MAVKKPGDMEFDFKLDDNLDFGDAPDSGDLDMRDDRRPVTIVAQSFATGAKDYLLNPQRQKEFIKKSLPKGYGDTLDTIDTGAKFAKELYDTAAQEFKPVTDSTKRILSSVLPKDGQYKPGGLTEKLAKWARKSGSGSGMDQEQMNENMLTAALGDIFKMQSEQDAAREQQQGAETKVNNYLNLRNQGTSIAYLQAIAHHASKLTSYQDNVAIKFQQKQLELTFRQYFTQVEILKTVRTMADVSKGNLTIIAKNTGLPDFVKMHNKEVVEQVLKTATIARLSEPMREWFAGSAKRLMSHYKGQMREFASNVGMVMESAASAVEATQAMGDSGMGQSRTQVGAELLGGALGDAAMGKLTSKLSPKVQEWAKKHPLIANWGLRLGLMNQRLPQILQDWVRGRSDETTVLGRFLNGSRDAVGEYKKGVAVRTSAADKLDEAVHFNLQSRQALVEIIPGWLQLIHNEQRMMRTGNDKLKPMTYSYESGQFEETGTAYKRVIDRVFDKSKVEHASNRLTDAMSAFDEMKLSDAEKAALSKFIIDRSEKDPKFSLKAFIEDDEFEGMDSAVSAKLKNKMRDYVGYSYEDKYDEQGNKKRKHSYDMKGAGQARLTRMARGYHEFQDALPNFQEILIKEMQKGNQQALIDLGLIEYDEASSTWNMKDEFFQEAVFDEFKRLTPEQQAKPGVWDKIMKDVMGRLQSALDGTTPPQTRFAKGGSVRKGKRSVGKGTPPEGSSFGQRFNQFRDKINGYRDDTADRLDSHLKSGWDRVRGWVQGRGTGTSDSIMAKLSNNEFVVRAQAAVQPGAKKFLEEFNQRGMAALTRWGGKAKEMAGKAGDRYDKFMADQYDHFPDDGRNMGPHQIVKTKKRTITDVYELLDQWAPLWGSGGLSIGGLGKLGTRMKGMLGRMDPRQLKKLGIALDREALKDHADRLKLKASEAWMKAEEKYMGGKGALSRWFGIGKEKFQNGLGKVRGKATWLRENILSKIPGMAQSGFGNLKHFMNDRLSRFKDIYVEGEEEPRLLGERMREGAYRDRKTGKIIKSLKDITGPVDDAQTGKVIISIANFKKGLYDKFGKRVLTRVTDKLMNMVGSIKKPFTSAKNFGIKTLRFLNAYQDVYVKGEEEPRLFANKLQEGYYRDKKTKKVIYKVADISGAVIDPQGNLVLSVRDFKKGLVDKNGKPITSLGQKAKRLAQLGFEALTNGATWMAGKAWAGVKAIGRTALNMKDWFGKGWDKLKNADFNLGFGIMVNKPVVNKLEEIRKVLDERLPGGKKKKAANDSDGDGFRDGSAAEQKQAADAKAEKKEKGRLASILEKLGGFKDKAKDKAKAAGGGFMDMLGNLTGSLSNLAKNFTGMLGGFMKWLPAATSLLSIGGRALGGLVSGGGAVLKGAGVLARGALTIGRFALPAIGSLITTVGGGLVTAAGAILTSPALLTAAAVAAVGYVGYKLVTYAMKEDDYGMRWRMIQYGVDPDEEKQVQKILTLEQIVLKGTLVSKSSPAKLGPGIKVSEIMKLFDVADQDEEHMKRVLAWLKYRFKPIFLSTVTIYFDITSGSKDIQSMDQKLSTDQLLDLVKKSNFPRNENSPYAFAGLPFKEEEKSDYSQEDIYDEYADIIDDIEDNRKDQDKKAIASRGKDPAKLLAERKKKQEESNESWWGKMKAGSSKLWDKTKDSVSGAMKSLKDGKDYVVDRASMGIETAAKAAKSAWSWVSDNAAGARDAVSGAAGDAIDFAKRVGGNVATAIGKIDSNQLYQSILKYAKYAGVTTPAGLAMYLGQMYEETGGFKVVSENLNYKADTMMKLFSRAKKAGRAAVEQVAKAGPIAVAEFLYGGRMGNDEPGDGWKYRGRGPLQLTGKGNYKAAAEALGIDLVNKPDLMLDPDIGAKVSAWYFKTRVDQKALNAGDLRKVTKQVNGGYINLEKRAADVAGFAEKIRNGTLSMEHAEEAAAKASATTQPEKAPTPAAPPLPKTPAAAGEKPGMIDRMSMAIGDAIDSARGSGGQSPAAAKTEKKVVAQHQAATAAAGAAAATSQTAAAKSSTASDNAMASTMSSLLKVNQDQLTVLKSMEDKMTKFFQAGGKGSVTSQGTDKTSPSTPATPRKNKDLPVNVGSL